MHRSFFDNLLKIIFIKCKNNNQIKQIRVIRYYQINDYFYNNLINSYDELSSYLTQLNNQIKSDLID